MTIYPKVKGGGFSIKTQATALAQMREVLTAGEQLVDVGLVAGVEHDGVPR